MSKGLEALERLHEFAWSNEEYRNDMDNTDYQIVEKELKRLEEIDNVMFLNNKKLKALEIIKKKKVNVFWLFNSKDVDEYNSAFYQEWRYLTQKEYDLLKEVLL